MFDFVPYGAVAARLLVLAREDETSVLGIVDPAGPGVTRTPLTPLDHGPAAAISIGGAPIQVVAEGIDAERRHGDAILRWRLGVVAELVGVAAAANEAATEYAKVRVAFDRPIGTFQAIKHRLVDQRSAIEVGRALVNRAADACDRSHPDAAALVSLAAFWAMDSLRAVPEGATQVFGGIAYTWEHEAHVYLRRAATLAASLGSRAQHRKTITDWLATRH
jgi:alkylation response protein AidB-like acyl-CoA dehydrogenase